MTNYDYDLSGTPPVPYRSSIARMKKGGLTAEFFSLYIKPDYVMNGGAARRTLDMIDSVYRAVELHPNDLMFATTAADIRRAKAQGKIACLMGIEGGHAIENSLPTLREFYRLGVRYMTLTWNNTAMRLTFQRRPSSLRIHQRARSAMSPGTFRTIC